MNTTEKKQEKGYSILALLFPFVSFIVSIKNLGKSIPNRNILWLFIAFYGFNFTVTKRETDMDGLRRLEHFDDWAKETDLTWNSFVSKFDRTDEEAYTDYFEPILMAVVSRFTDNYRYLFLLYGIIAGFFIADIFNIIVEKLNIKIKTTDQKIILALLFVIIPFWQMQGFRFWFATILFIWMIIKFYETNNKKYLGILVLLPLIHFSFLFGLIMFVTYLLIEKLSLKLIFIIYSLSFFLTIFDISGYAQYLSIFSSSYESKAVGYTSEEYKETVNSIAATAVNFYVTLKGYSLIIVSNLMIVILYLNIDKIQHLKIKKLLVLSVAFLIVSNIFSSLPSMGRFYAPSYFIFFSFILLLINDIKFSQLFSAYKIVTYTFLSIYILVEIRICFDTFPITNLISNWLIAPFISAEYTLIDLVKDSFQ